MNLTLISAFLAAAIGFGAGWQLQTHQITKLSLEHANERITLQRSARTQAERHIETVRVAQNKAQSSMAVAVDNSKHLASELDGLRSQSDSALREASQSLDACLTSANAFSVVSNQCAERYSGLATEAQGHIIDKQALIESWPK